MPTSRLLVVDDDQNLLELVRARLNGANYDVVVAGDAEAAVDATKRGKFDLSIVDLRIADQDGMTLMERLHSVNPEMPVIILTGYASIESAVEAMKRGAYTYLTKPFDPRELFLQIERALESRKLASENLRLKGLLKEKYDFANIVAKSDKMQRVLEAVTRIANADSTVYIHGESGTGKELIAKAIHLASERKDKPLSRSIAPPSRKPCSKANFSVMRKARLRERCAAPRGYLPRRMKARFFSMRSATCRSPSRSSSCGLWRSGSFIQSGAKNRCRWMSGSSSRRRKTWSRKSRRGLSVKISFIAFTSFP